MSFRNGMIFQRKKALPAFKNQESTFTKNVSEKCFSEQFKLISGSLATKRTKWNLECTLDQP